MVQYDHTYPGLNGETSVCTEHSNSSSAFEYCACVFGSGIARERKETWKGYKKFWETGIIMPTSPVCVDVCVCTLHA